MQRDLPSALAGGPRNSEASRRRIAAKPISCGRVARRLAVGLAALALGMTIAVPAWADELDDERNRISQELTAAQAKLDSDTKSLANASSSLHQSRGRLAHAQGQLAETRRQLAEAQLEDETAAGRLAQAQNDLEEAKAAVAEGERHVAAQQVEVGNVARTQYQQRTGMVGIGMVVTGTSTGDINNRVQWSTTVFDSTQAELDELRAVQAQLVAARDRQARIEEEMAAERARAARNLATQQMLAARAAEEERAVAALVVANASLEAAASSQLGLSQAQARALSTEQTQVEARIADRLARQQAEDARLAEAARREREELAVARSRSESEAARIKAETEAAQERADAAQSRARTQGDSAAMPRTDSGPADSSPAGNAAASAEPAVFIAPVGGRVTSRFGMRLHPVLRVWKLHDGTDYGAGCNTPIRAAADGIVAERYYNAGYGNRLMIDHGRVDGQYMTTGYNHATRYTVRVGQRVKQGDVVGYVGNTGYSTGCHLHLMVWANGKVTNPQTVGF